MKMFLFVIVNATARKLHRWEVGFNAHSTEHIQHPATEHMMSLENMFVDLT